jgi:hypothetical protein
MCSGEMNRRNLRCCGATRCHPTVIPHNFVRCWHAFGLKLNDQLLRNGISRKDTNQADTLAKTHRMEGGELGGG